MAVKILAVDDSATMRKILEMTFAGEDAEVSVAESADNALSMAGSLHPDIVIADASLDGTDGYALSASIKSSPVLAQTAVILMASQHSPFDVARGKSSGVDDHVIKPFDTQAMIDKVSTVLAQPRAAAAPGVAVAAAPAPAVQEAKLAPPPPARPAAPRVAAPAAPPPRPSAPKPPPPAAARPAPPPKPAPPRPMAPKAPSRPATPAAQPAAPRPHTPSGTSEAVGGLSGPAPVAAAPAAAASVAHAATAATAGSGDLATKLSSMGLSSDQVAGVLALSREVIEQVVWEVVPDLAEVIIREEIRRLTSP